jgi:3-hydroxyisobutyrate dehydrogenase-like beta-hydroxyacid dehydrogenase
MRKVGIVGSGALARAVSARLLEYGLPVLVWGPDEEGVGECVRAGAAVASTPAEVASQAQFIIVAAADGPESERWHLGDHGVIQGMCDGRVVVDMTTISPALAHRLSHACREAGGAFLDAPVSGGAPAARTGNLVVMVGGSETAYDMALPVLEPLGRIIVRVGETGSGAIAKLCSQVMCFVNLCGVCEGLALGAKAGIDLRKLFSITTSGAAQSWELDNMGPKILARDLATGYPVSTSQYDLSLVLDAARELKVFLPATSIVHQLYHAVEMGGQTGEASQALIRALETMSGVEVRG